MPRSRKDHTYFGVELPNLDLEILRRLADDYDTPVSSLVRRAVARWIENNPDARMIKSGLVFGEDAPDTRGKKGSR